MYRTDGAEARVRLLLRDLRERVAREVEWSRALRRMVREAQKSGERCAGDER